MQFRRQTAAWTIGLSLLGIVAAQLALAKKKPNPNTAQMDEQKRAVHVLNRLAFGPRPGDVERVAAMGVDKWIDLQLHPERIDDSVLDARLEPFSTLRMDTREMVENFPPQPLIRAIADGKQPFPPGAKRVVYEAQIERYRQQQERKPDANASAAPANTTGKPIAMTMMSDDGAARRQEDRLYAELDADKLLDLPPHDRMQAVFKMSPGDQLAFVTSLKGDKLDQFLQGMDPQQRETFVALDNPQQVVNQELFQGKLLRATYSERQLQEVMTDFWFNHFNIFIGKGADRYMLTSYERDVIRPHAFGKFEDLLVATAKSPAMLFYLDNWLSVGPESDAALGVPKRPAGRNQWRARFPNGPPRKPKANRAGLNENYGRELMELHTLGVNGGYTQKDVTEVARVFTGWTLKEPREGGSFNFDERKHQPGDKQVLGHRIKSKGEKEGLEVLRILARHPSTAKFVCTKLAMRFVSDNPPPQLVDQMAKTFLKKHGDIREVLKTMFDSPEFWAPEAYRAKLKTPLEFVVSAVRASGAEVSDAMPLVRQLQNMGMPLYGMQPPTGYSMKADSWVNSSALLGRMNFSLALTAGRFKGVQVEAGRALASVSPPTDSQQALAVWESALLAGDISKQTHDTIAARLQDPKIAQRKLDDPVRPPNVAMIEGLLLGSPEFQKR
jgi:uncharacterized protein (DUF1800 family)